MTTTSEIDFASITLPPVAEQSETQLDSPATQPNADIAPSPLPGTYAGTSRRFLRKRRRQPSQTKDDELMNAWLSAEIGANSLRAELSKAQIELVKEQTELAKEQKELAKEQKELARQKMKVLKLQEKELMAKIKNVEPDS